MSWDKKVAVNYAKSHASSHSQGRCAEYTRKAVQAGGVTLGRTYHAKDYGPMLKNAGFSAIGALEYGEGNHLILPGEGWINRECAGLVGAVQHLI